MTERLFLADPALQQAEAVVVAAGPDGVVLDRTPFYAKSGGQPGDTGRITWQGGQATILEAVRGEGDAILHPVEPGSAVPPVGAPVTVLVDWPRRHRHMRMHTALHLLCSLLPGAGVTGGQIGAERSRLDFDLPEAPSKDALEAGFAKLVAAAHPVAAEWVDEAVLDSDPGLVRTLSVKPPRGGGRLRLVRIGSAEALVDVQPCGGTHIASTAEIGEVRVLKIENKGRQNRRIQIGLAD